MNLPKNILIGSGTSGIIGESNVIRIGVGTGISGGQVNQAFIKWHKNGGYIIQSGHGHNPIPQQINSE